MKTGIQIYNFRDQVKTDFKGTLKKIAEMGFDGVEFSVGLNILPPDELAAYLKEIGLECCGIMTGVENLQDPESQVWEYAEALNTPAMLFSQMTDFKTRWKEVMETAIAAQKVTEQKGYLLAYHNHWAEYDLVDGVPAMFRILEGAEKLGVEPDICWLHRGGINPADYIRKYKDRIQQIHFKDIVVPDDPDTTTELGRGVVDIKAAFAAAKEIDCQWYILEQDYSADPMQSAKESFAYLKSLEM